MGIGRHVISRAPGSSPRSVTVRLVGGLTALLEIDGLRLLTDPTSDRVGSVVGAAQPPVGSASRPMHGVLLSQHRHADGLDGPGRLLFPTVPMTLTTAAAADRLGRNATALSAWYPSHWTGLTAARSRSPAWRSGSPRSVSPWLQPRASMPAPRRATSDHLTILRTGEHCVVRSTDWPPQPGESDPAGRAAPCRSS